MGRPLPLPDHLEPGLSIVFVGINPGAYSARVGHYFARPGNRFWQALYEAGLVPELWDPTEDARLLDLGMGLTDVVKRPSDRADELSRAELDAGAAALREKISGCQPRVAAFVGLTGLRACVGEGARPGLQAIRWGRTSLYGIPSTSGRNAAYPWPVLLHYFQELRRLRDHLASRDP